MLACPHRFLRMCPFEVRQLALREVKLFTGSRVGMQGWVCFPRRFAAFQLTSDGGGIQEITAVTDPGFVVRVSAASPVPP